MTDTRTVTKPRDRPPVLIIDHNRTDQCGVYQLGKRTAAILEGSTRYRFLPIRADSMQEFMGQAQERAATSLCIFNYYPAVMPWMALPYTPPNWIGIAHEITHVDAHTPQPPFAKWVIFDPSFPDSDIYLRTMPPLPASYTGEAKPQSDRLVVGSCGFALPGKGYEYILKAVADEFKGAELNPLVRLHIPPAHFAAGFPHEQYYNLLASRANDRGIDLEITSDFKTDEALLEFLATNHLNCLFYGPNQGRGISSAADFCIAAGRPLAITASEQFRHLRDVLGVYPQQTLTQTLTTGDGVCLVERLQAMFSHERFIARWEEIVDSLIGQPLGGGG